MTDLQTLTINRVVPTTTQEPDGLTTEYLDVATTSTAFKGTRLIPSGTGTSTTGTSTTLTSSSSSTASETSTFVPTWTPSGSNTNQGSNSTTIIVAVSIAAVIAAFIIGGCVLVYKRKTRSLSEEPRFSGQQWLKDYYSTFPDRNVKKAENQEENLEKGTTLEPQVDAQRAESDTETLREESNPFDGFSQTSQKDTVYWNTFIGKHSVLDSIKRASRRFSHMVFPASSPRVDSSAKVSRTEESSLELPIHENPRIKDLNDSAVYSLDPGPIYSPVAPLKVAQSSVASPARLRRLNLAP